MSDYSMEKKISDLLGPSYVPVNLLTGLDIEGNTPVDASATINSYLLQAKPGRPVKLIFDIGVGCYGSVLIPPQGHVTLEGCGWDTGIYMMNGSNSHCVTNELGRLGSGYPTFDPNTTAPAQSCMNVRIANLFLNGNRGNGTTGNSTSGDPKAPTGAGTTGTWLCGIDIISAQGISVEDVYFYNIPTFNIRVGNVTNALVRGCIFDGSAVQSINNDGLHVDGPATRIVAAECVGFDCLDDMFACNAPEGYGGDITDVAMTNWLIYNCLTAFRCYTMIPANARQFHVKGVTVSNVSCALYTGLSGTPAAGVFLGNNSEGTTDSIDGVAVSNLVVRSSGVSSAAKLVMLKVSDNCGSVTLDGCTLEAWGNGPFLWTDDANGTSAITISDLSFYDCKIYNNSDTYGMGSVGGNLSATIARCYLDIQMSQPSGAGYSNFPYLIDPTKVTISDLEIPRLNPTYLTALISGSTWTNLPLIRGAGVLESQFQIPDAQMANGVLYVSATSPNVGKVCFKNMSGTVVALG